jgi:hypothetical protein
LSDSELPKFWDAFAQLGIEGAALKALLLTGQRPGEVVHMRTEHIEDGWWTMTGRRCRRNENPVDALHAFGCNEPISQSFKVNGELAFKTALMTTPWTEPLVVNKSVPSPPPELRVVTGSKRGVISFHPLPRAKGVGDFSTPTGGRAAKQVPPRLASSGLVTRIQQHGRRRSECQIRFTDLRSRDPAPPVRRGVYLCSPAFFAGARVVALARSITTSPVRSTQHCPDCYANLADHCRVTGIDVAGRSGVGTNDPDDSNFVVIYGEIYILRRQPSA